MPTYTPIEPVCRSYLQAWLEERGREHQMLQRRAWELEISDYDINKMIEHDSTFLAVKKLYTLHLEYGIGGQYMLVTP